MKLLQENLLAAVFLITLAVVDGFFFFPGPIIYPKTTTTPEPPKPAPKPKPKESKPKHDYGQPIFIPVPYGYGQGYEHKTTTTTTPKPMHTYPPQPGGYYAFIPYGYGDKGYESEETTETETEAPTTTPAPPTEKTKPAYSHHIPLVIPPPFPFFPQLPSLFHKAPLYHKFQPIYSYTPPPGYKEEIIEEEEARGLPNKPPKNAVTVVPPNFMKPMTEHSYRPQFELDEPPGFMSDSYPDQYRPPGLKRPNGPPIYTSPPRKQPNTPSETGDKPKNPPPRVYSSPPRKPSRNYAAPPRKPPAPEISSFDSNEVADTPPARVYSPPPRYGPPRKLTPYNKQFGEYEPPRNYLPPPRTPVYGPPAPVTIPTTIQTPETTVPPQTTTTPAEQFYLPPQRAPASPALVDLNQPSRVYDVPPPPQQYKPAQNQANGQSSSIYLPPQRLDPQQTSRVYDVPPPSQKISPAKSPYSFYLPPQRPPAQSYKSQSAKRPPNFDTTTPATNEVTPMQPPALPAVYETPAHMQVRNMPSYLQPPSLPASFEMPGFSFERMTQANQNYLPPFIDGEHNNLNEMQLANSANNIMLLEQNINDMNTNFNVSSTSMDNEDKVELVKIPLNNDFEILSDPLTANKSKPTLPNNLVPKNSIQLSVSPSTMPPPELPTKYEMPRHKDERKFFSSDETSTSPTVFSTLEPYKINIFPSRRPAVDDDYKHSDGKNVDSQAINSGLGRVQSANQDSTSLDEENLATDRNNETIRNESVFPALPVRQEGASKDKWNLRDTVSNPLLEPAGTPSNAQIELIKRKIEMNKNTRHRM